MNDLEKINCPICESGFSIPLEFWRDNRYPAVRLVKCCGCGFYFQNPRLSQQLQNELYGISYFNEGLFSGSTAAGTYFNQERESIRICDFASMIQYEGIIPRGNKRLLEIGCAGGNFLVAARQVGWNVQGCEISSSAASHASNQYALDVHAGDLISAKYPTGYFEMVCMFDVLEHIPNINQFLSEIHRILVPRGVLFIALPVQTQSLLFKMQRRLWDVKRIVLRGEKISPLMIDNIHHLWEFNHDTIERLLNKNNFSIFWERKISTTYSDMLVAEPQLSTTIRMKWKTIYLFINLLNRIGMEKGSRLNLKAESMPG